MKKIITLVVLLCSLVTVTSCNSDTIIPKGYYDSDVWTTSNVSTYANFINYIKYYYNEDMTSSLKKNKFLEKVDSTSLEDLSELLNIFEEEVNNYNYEEGNTLKENYNLKVNNVTFDDYIYIDYRVNNQYDPETSESIYDYFMIYYFDVSDNTLYYCSLEY